MNKQTHHLLMSQYETPTVSDTGIVSWDDGVKAIIPQVTVENPGTYVACGKNLFNVSAVKSIASVLDLSIIHGTLQSDGSITCKYGSYGGGCVINGQNVYFRSGDEVTISADVYYADRIDDAYGITFGLRNVTTRTPTYLTAMVKPAEWTRIKGTFNVGANIEGICYIVLQPNGNSAQHTNLNCAFKNILVVVNGDDTEFIQYEDRGIVTVNEVGDITGTLAQSDGYSAIYQTDGEPSTITAKYLRHA